MEAGTSCHFCDCSSVSALFSEQREGRLYTSYYCHRCDLYQTLGDIDPVSPDYVTLSLQDLDHAHRFLQNEHKLPAFKQWRSLMAKHLGQELRGASLLDIGCGIGGFLDYAKSCGVTTFGFDASDAHVQEALSRHPNVRKAVSIKDYFQDLGMSASPNMVTLWDVFEHIRRPESLLQEIRELIRRTNGCLFVSVPNGAINPTKVWVARILRRPFGLIPWEHVFYYTTKSLCTVLNRSGFRVVKIGGVKPYLRKPITLHEGVRRTMHHLLRRTHYAFQIYAIARAT